jgi:acetolactate synthase-1/2/3 large subunit
MGADRVSGETVPEIVRKAFKIAETEKPGVTVIELPEDVAKEDVDRHVMAPTVTRRPAADHKAVRAAIDAIEQATNPIILAGNGALRKRAAKQLRRFARKTGIPVVNTFMGKGTVAMTDPHCLFTMGLQGRDHVNKAFEKSDTVITVGYDLVEIAPVF